MWSLRNAPDATIPGLKGPRAACHKDGILDADAILVPLEDGDRCQALVAMNKDVVVIDLNHFLARPNKRTSPLWMNCRGGEQHAGYRSWRRAYPPRPCVQPSINSQGRTVRNAPDTQNCMSSALTEFLCKALSDALSNGRTRSRSAQIVSQHVACLEVVGDALIDEAADFNQILIVGFAAQVFHHLNGIDGRNELTG